MIVLKSKREIGLMRKAGLLVWRAHRRVAELIEPGVTTARLDAVVEDLFVQENAVGLFKGYPGEVPFPAVTCISVNEQVVHGIPSDRVLCEGDIVSVDTGCKLNGWCGDAAVTHPVGQIDASAGKLLDATEGVLNLAVELLGVKEQWGEIAEEMERYIRAAGFSVVTQFVGHGIGREMHEDPQVPNFVGPRFVENYEDFRIRPGLVLAVEPMVNMGESDCKVMGDQWTQVTSDGRLSAHFEHTIAVTRDGPQLLTGPPREDELI